MKDIFPITVRAVSNLSPSLIRVVFSVARFAEVEFTPHPDEWVSLWFPDEAGELPQPARRPFGHRLPRERSRPYTLRNLDRQNDTVTIDIVRHPVGLAASWATQARVGDQLLMSQPEGRFEPPATARRVLLFADITGFPAVARILEDLPESLMIVPFLTAPFAADRQALATPDHAQLRWHHTADASGEFLVQEAKAVSFRTGQDYVWIAAEASVVAQLKRHFRAMRATVNEVTAIGYWIQGQSRR